MERPHEKVHEGGITVEESFKEHIGEFGWGQVRNTLMADYVWTITAMSVYLISLAEGDPVAEGKWKCISDGDVVCTAIKGLDDKQDIRNKFCALDSGQWEWTSRGSSIVSEFDMACESFQVQLVKSVFFIGWMIGAGSLGYISDKFGRHSTMYASAVIAFICIIACSFAPFLWVYAIFRMGVGIGVGGIGTASFVLVSESIGESMRGKHAFFCQFQFVVGNCIIVGIALLTDSWRGLTFIVGLLSGVFIPTYWLLPRSPRWLLINGRKEEAMQILAVIAHRNKRKMPTEDIVVSSALQSTDKTIVQSLKHPKLRLYLTIAMMTWIIVCMVYYGIALVLDTLPGNLLFKFFLIQIIEFPSLLTYMLLIDVVGRKPLYITGFAIAGVACLLVPVMPKHLVLPMAIMGKFGADGAFSEAYIYTSEMFPTPARSFCLGWSNLSARVGGVLAPQIPLLAPFLGSNAPFIIFGAAGIFACLISFALPETMGRPMPDTIQDVDEYHTKPRKRWFGNEEAGQYQQLQPESSSES